MAYGKIKADTLVYDNSGTDTEVTVASLTQAASLPASAGTVGASEVVQVDANKDITGFRNITLSGDLTVNGTTTTIDSTTLTVEDKNIELGKVSTPTDTTADGGGITLKGATDKTFNWVDATDAWTSSEHIHVEDNKKLIAGTGSDVQIYHDGSNSFINNTTGRLRFETDSAGYGFYKATGTEWLAKLDVDGAVELYYDGSKKFETTSAGVTVTGSVTDDKGDVRSIPQNWQSSGSVYTLVASDAGKHVGTNGNVTVPASVFNAAGGDAVTILNHGTSDITIYQGNNLTMYNSADAATGDRTLSEKGVATILFVNGTTCYISGAGLS